MNRFDHGLSCKPCEGPQQQLADVSLTTTHEPLERLAASEDGVLRDTFTDEQISKAYMAVSISGVHFWGGPGNESPIILGSILGPLTSAPQESSQRTANDSSGFLESMLACAGSLPNP